MLKFLKTNLDSQRQNLPKLIAADLAGFNLAAQFPLIILPCNTFSTLTVGDRRACLRCVRGHLQKDGIFAVCLPNLEMLLHLPLQSEAEMEDEFIHPQTGNPVQVSSTWRRRKHSFQVTWIYDHLLPNGTVDRLEVDVVHQLTPYKTYLSDIENGGLMVKEYYGDFDRSVYRADSAYLILLVSH
jgi:hypothetical protein